jgi:hypothetical protein
MHSRLAALVAAGVLAIAGLATGTAHAAAPITDTVRVVNNLDSGTNGSWAWVNHTRTVSITETRFPGTYRVTLTDNGTLRTIRGAKSPQAGVTIPREVPGTFSGRYSFTVVSKAEPSVANVADRMDYGCQIGGTCPGKVDSGNWPKLYFGDQDVRVTPGSWRWEYRTCAEAWVNSSAGNRGDITGKRCERAVRPESPTVAQPECGAEKGKLVIPADRGVFYKVRTADRPSRVVRAGTYDVRPGTYWVTAHAVRGYELRGDRLWRLVVEQAEVCPTPTPTPTVTVTPTVDPTPDPEPTPTVTETETEEPTPAPTVTQRQVIVINDMRVPDRVDTGRGGLATK